MTCIFIFLCIYRKPSELLELGSVLKDQVPVIRRFTGGGTVIVDKDTVFVTFICNKDDVPGVQPYPRSIMSWSGLLYSQMFQGIGDFQLRENGILVEFFIEENFLCLCNHVSEMLLSCVTLYKRSFLLEETNLKTKIIWS